MSDEFLLIFSPTDEVCIDSWQMLDDVCVDRKADLAENSLKTAVTEGD